MSISRKMTSMPAIKSVMTAFPYSVEAGATVSRAREMMDAHDIRHLPVMEKGKLVGVVSDRDIALALDPAVARTDERELHVRDVIVREAYVVELDEDLDNVLLQMAERQVESALVVREGKLAGIFTVTDACARFHEFLRAWFPRGDDDKAA